VPEIFMQTEFARAQMVGQQIRAWDVLDERVLDAMRRTPARVFRTRTLRLGWRSRH
jgi:protein-L-isoaspartate O-methyltransferase